MTFHVVQVQNLTTHILMDAVLEKDLVKEQHNTGLMTWMNGQVYQQQNVFSSVTTGVQHWSPDSTPVTQHREIKKVSKSIYKAHF